MTKKPSEKNKAWEKDRRDRLNKTFDELAKLLPKYDPSVVWSKIEIIQKAITFITDLQKKQEDYLKTKDPELFKEYEEFVSCLKFYQERNAQLTALLKKAKVTLPPVVLPQLLVDKPELLPKADEGDVCIQKTKRQRNRAKKGDADAKKIEDKEEDNKVEHKNIEEVAEQTPEKDKKSPLRPITTAPVEVVSKPTAIITAFTRETPIETLQIIVPPSPSPQIPQVPVLAKPLLLRIRKPDSYRRLKLVPKPTFRKCYPHPGRTLRWNNYAASHLNVLSNRSRKTKRKKMHKKESGKRIKIGITPERIREQSVSPTAAFLLSFPVVTSSMSSGKNVENTENSVSLENLNNFFTTEEYSKFCDQNSVNEEKIPTPLQLESGSKPLMSGKPMTSFTVSAITRPSSPKNPIGQCKQKGLKEPPWIVENKLIQSLPATSAEGCYNFSSMNPMIGSTCMMGPNSQQATPTQYSVTNATPVTCFLPSTSEEGTSVKLELRHTALVGKNLNSTGKSLPILNQSLPSTDPTINPLKSATQSTPSAALNANSLKSGTYAIRSTVSTESSLKSSIQPSSNIAPTTLSTQKGGALTNPQATISWTAKSPAQVPSTVPKPRSVATSALTSCKTTSSFDTKVASLPTTDLMTKTTNKPPVSSFYSPTKTFFYDFPTQSQSISTFNFNLPSCTTLSSADPLISSTTATKSHSFVSLPSIKAEFPWLTPNTTSFSTSLTPTTTATTPATCNLNTTYTPYDLASIVCEPLTTTSFTFSLTTPKASELTVVDAGNKQNSSNKCNQMNLFLPYEDAQYTTTFSMTKPTETQPWKPEKTKDLSDQIFYDCEQSKPQQKLHVNWMTSPTTDYTSAPTALPLPPIDFGNQFPSSNFDFGFGRKDSYDDDNQFINWSPTKPLTSDFSTAYSFENFGSNEAPPNKTVKQIFSVSQLVEQTPPQETSSLKKTPSKAKSKQTFSNIYSAESLIAKKDNHRMTNVTNFYTAPDPSNTQPNYHNTNNYFYNYPNTQSCLQTENDFLVGSSYSASSTAKTTSILPPAGGGTSIAPVIPSYDSTTASSSAANYFSHSISSNTNDPYDPTYFPSSNYSHPTTTNWNPGTTKGGPPITGYNPTQLYGGTVEQQNPNVSGNLTNFNLSSICPEIDGKNGASGW